MKIRYVTIAIVVALLLLAPTFLVPSAKPESMPRATSVPTATLRAASGATIRFRPQNGRATDNVPIQAWDVPHLVLYRNGGLTAPDERTLTVEVTDIEVPPTGVTVTLKVQTQHGDPDLGDDPSDRIAVWRESQWIGNTSAFTQTGATVVFRHEFGEAVTSSAGTIATPTDYFRYSVRLIGAGHPVSDPMHTLAQDYAFLMENQWIARLPEVAEETGGAAPDELIVYYCDMFPFRRRSHDTTTWLLRRDARDYVPFELVPQMIEAFRMQSYDWRFPWYEAWTSYRSGEDAERLSVALTDGGTWFHGWAPGRGHSGISINVNGGPNAHYDTLTDGLLSNFHHELFHNLQRSISQNRAGKGRVDGNGDAWQFFSEGTAVLASSVGQPGVQFAGDWAVRDYMSYATQFAGGDGVFGDLNTSYAEINPYHAALYWRFLYEQCGGMKDGVEDPTTGMRVIHRALKALYSKDVVDIQSSTDLVKGLPVIMDQAFADTSLCPFQDYEDSLIQFASAVYELRLAGGRCTEPGTPAGCGLYDPHNLYNDPRVDTITCTGTTIIYDEAHQLYPPGIRSSFGMDFVEVILAPPVDGLPLTLELYGAPEADAEFKVQLWKLIASAERARPQRVGSDVTATETLTVANPDGPLSYAISEIDTTECNRLGLIITRIDAGESLDPVGAYTIVLHSDADSAGDGITDGA
jgi:hypothetical protein